jgi:hypothetical protein
MPRRRQMSGMRVAIVVTIIALIVVIPTAAILLGGSLSGYQSVTANWYKVVWPNAQTGTKTFTKSLSGPTFNWNPDATGVETNGAIPDGADDLSTISGTVENPKFDRHPAGDQFYNSWWINDTVSESNPTGEAKRYEWSIDIYTLNINIRAVGGTAYFINPPQIWIEIQNNVNSVFKNTGAEEAASYVIYAQTESYSWQPASAGWHIIDPTTGNFEIKTIDTTAPIPPVPEEGSNLNFDNLAKYSHVALPLTLTQFGTARFGSEPVVNMVVELSILTLGRWDYVLTYVSGGDNDIAPVGDLGVFDSFGAAIGAGLSALGDGLSNIFGAALGPIIGIAVIVIVIVVFILILRTGLSFRKKKQ